MVVNSIFKAQVLLNFIKFIDQKVSSKTKFLGMLNVGKKWSLEYVTTDTSRLFI